MKDPRFVVKALIRTEKGQSLLPLGKYLFWVDTKANKVDIKNAVENIYKVKVVSVNTMFARGKTKRVRFEEGKTADWKKAVVTLKEGEKIETA